jgi:transposase InsO family protein
MPLLLNGASPSRIREARDHQDRRAVASPARQTLDQLGIARRTFYRWYDRYLEGGPEALEDRPSVPSRVWNRIPAGIHDRIIELALEQSGLSPRELAVRFTDEPRYFVSEATVYRLLKAHDLITSPAFVVIKAADQFHTKTTRPNELWQTDFTCFKIIGWGWMYLSTVLDDFSRYIIAWKLCTNMRAEDVTDTLDLALAASGCDSAAVLHKPRLLTDNVLCREAAAGKGQQVSLRRGWSALMNV